MGTYVVATRPMLLIPPKSLQEPPLDPGDMGLAAPMGA